MFHGESGYADQRADLAVRIHTPAIDTIHSRRSLTLESVKAIAQQRDVDVVEQGSEPFLPPFPCCFSHTGQPLGHAVPALSREHA
jgi:hypothetical protein